MVDFAIGSDCGGSIRIPASYCGIIGLRPTHGRVPLDGAVPFGPSFDVAGWFARDPDVFARVSRVLLRDRAKPKRPRRVLVARDAFDVLDAGVAASLQPAVDRLKSLVGSAIDVTLADEGLPEWFENFRVIQAAEIWQCLGAWVTARKPALGPGVKERLEWAATVTPDMRVKAEKRRVAICSRLAEVMRPGDVICLPSSPRVAPALGTPTDKIEVEYRHQAMCLLCISGHTGLPQISLPLARHEGLPLGLSIIGAHGADMDLVGLGQRLV